MTINQHNGNVRGTRNYRCYFQDIYENHKLIAKAIICPHGFYRRLHDDYTLFSQDSVDINPALVGRE